jgi:hypothetical protein
MTMSSLKSRLQDELIGPDSNTGTPSVSAIANGVLDQQRAQLSEVASHIAADVEGLIPKAKDQNNPKLESWEMHQAIGFNDALAAVDDALARYMKGTD